jgi:hypothetical protein
MEEKFMRKNQGMILESLRVQRVAEAIALGLRTAEDVAKYLNNKISPLFQETFFKAEADKQFGEYAVTITYVSASKEEMKKSNTMEFNAGVRFHLFLYGFDKEGNITPNVKVNVSNSGWKNKDVKLMRQYSGDIDTAVSKIVRYFTDNQVVLSDKSQNGK